MYDVQFVATTSADWAQAIELIDADTNLPLSVPDDATFSLSIGDGCWSGDFNASTADGQITRPADNVIQWQFTPASLSSYCRRGSTNPVGLTMTTTEGTIQIFVGTLTIIDGIV